MKILTKAYLKDNLTVKHRNISYCFYILSFFLFFTMSCKHKDKYKNISERIADQSKNYHGITLSSKPFLEGKKMIKISEDNHNFLIPERKSHIKSFACTECHTKPLKKVPNNQGKKAHWDIELVHANPNVMNCATCHNTKNMDQLLTLSGNVVDMNLSYKLCGQCHSSEFKDWKGGAHGKKIKSWASPRASRTCVNCHSPHSPKFESRWPARFNTQKVMERKEDINH